MPMPWFRLYSELLSDRKLAYVVSTCGVPKVTVVGFWTGLLCLANDSPERGRVLLAEGMPLDAKAIAQNIGIDEATCDTLLDALLKVSMITKPDGYYIIRNWDDRQFASDDVGPRVRKSREKKRSSNVSTDRYCNTPDQIRTDTEQSRTEEEADAPNGAAPKTRKERDKLHGEWAKYLEELFFDYPLMVNNVKAQAQLVGREGDLWIVKHNAHLNETLHARLPGLYDRMLERVRFVP